MATVPVNDTTPRNQYSASAAQTIFDYDFIIFAEADLAVYVDGTLQTLTTHYTITDVLDPDGGTVVFVVGRSAGEIIVIEGEVAIERLTDYQPGGQFDPEDLNLEQDKQIAMMKQINRDVSFHLTFDTSLTTTTEGAGIIPEPVDDTTLAFDGTTGAMKLGPTTAAITAAASEAVAAAASAAAALVSEGNASTSETNAAASEAAAAAAVGSVKITASDTTASVLDTALIAGTALTKTTNSPGADETMTIDLDDTAVTPAAYTAANITIDQQGRIIAAASGTAVVAATETTAGIVELATAAEVTTGTDTGRVPSVSTMVAHEGISKAWVNFNGQGTVAIRDSYNITSITDHGIGNYSANWDTDFANTNYVLFGFCMYTSASNTAGLVCRASGDSKAVGSMEFRAGNSTSAVEVDFEEVFITAFGDQ